MRLQASLEPLLRHLFEIIVERQIIRGFVERQHQRIKGQFQVATLGDLQRTAARFRIFRERLVHLLRRFDIVLLWIVAHALGIAVTLARTNAKQNIVRNGIASPQIMAVIGRHQWHVHIFAKGNQLPVDLGLRL